MKRIALLSIAVLLLLTACSTKTANTAPTSEPNTLKTTTSVADINTTTTTGTATSTLVPPGSMAGVDTLIVITVNSGTLSPNFTPDITDYTVNVDSSVNSIEVLARSAANGGSLQINGVATNFGVYSAPISLHSGSNVITILVTSPNGANKMTYKVTVTR